MEQTQSNHRRNFLKQAAVITATGLSIPQIVSAFYKEENFAKKLKLNPEDVILFQGDSITDSGRKKEDANFNNASAMGNGYAIIAAAELLFKKADYNLKIYNRGISGNKVYQLAERWDKDCLELKPDVLSILIGVNDFWHTLSGKYTATVKKYKDDFKELLDRTKKKLPEVKLLIGEPFAVTGIKAVDEKWYPAFDEYRSSSRDIADTFNAVFVPYQNIFDAAQKVAPGVYWTHDGVHPTLAGAQLMAHAWLQAVKY